MNLLYYPQIAIPMAEIKKYILYADKISSIVPANYSFIEDSEDAQWNESINSMNYLETMGIYEKTYSSTVLNKYRQGIIDEFLKRIDKTDIYKKVKCGDKPTHWWELYLSKLDNDIKELLIDEGLAKENNGETILIASEISAIYMGLLAEYASTYGQVFYSTVTNDYFYKELVYNPIQENDSTIRLKFSISNILPVPSEEVPIDDILKFKESRRDELIRFQLLIKEIQNFLTKVDNIRDYRDAVDTFEKQLYLQLFDLKSLLKEQNIRFINNTIDSILPNSLEDIILPKSTGSFLKIGSVVEKRLNKKSLVRSSPISYILSAKNERIIN